VPRTLDNMREFDPTILTGDPSKSNQLQEEELAHDLASDPFASYFNTVENPTSPPKVLITTSPQASKATYDFCDELLGVFPGAEFRRRTKGKGFELGRIAGWAADRGYKHMCVVNEDMKKPSAHLHVVWTCRLTHLVRCHYTNLSPRWPFCLLQVDIHRTYETNICMTFSLQSTKCMLNFAQGHGRATAHYPELVLNGFVTRLGHTIGRMFQTAFPQLPEFQGRQVVTFHNQRDFIFFRRHR